MRRSRMALTNTASRVIENVVSLDRIMGLLSRSDVRGPFALHACHKGAVSLGAGAQFDVHGRRMPVANGFPRFDGPYLEEPLWQEENGTPQTFAYTTRHVAIKRAYNLSEHRFRPSVVAVKLSDGRGVERSQLRNVTHEILSLIHPLLRQHPNIITLLGWGYDQAENDATVFSPVLIVEHARMSAEHLSTMMDLPFAIKMHICHGMLSAIKALHECGIVHNDVKPGNLLVFAKNDSPFLCIAKISDFGFAEQEVRDRSIDVSELPQGTTGWAAPEQEIGDPVPVDLVHRRDIWGAGLTVWSILALRGQAPYTYPDVEVQLAADLSKWLAPPNFSTALLPPLAACVCREVSHRADSVENLRVVLEPTEWTDPLEVKAKCVCSTGLRSMISP